MFRFSRGLGAIDKALEGFQAAGKSSACLFIRTMASDVAYEIFKLAQSKAQMQVSVMLRHRQLVNGRSVGDNARCTLAPIWVGGRLMIKSGGITLVADDDKAALSIIRTVVEDTLQCAVSKMATDTWPPVEPPETVLLARVRLERYCVEDMINWWCPYESNDGEDLERVLSNEPFALTCFARGDVVSDTVAKVLQYMKLARHAV